MFMTKELAENLMSDLMALAISANGGIELDEKGEPIMSKEQEEKVEKYAKATFVKLCDEWEETMGKEWKVEVEEDVL